MRKIGLAFFLLNTINLQASICPQLSGKWQGVWSFSRIDRNLGHLEITKNIKGDFTGIYKIGKVDGTFSGRCSAISPLEAYLILTPDPPFYNPCRGTLLQVKDSELVLHIFCFKPNEQGYFQKKIT